MPNYRLATHQAAQRPRAGLVVGEQIFDLAAATGNPSDAALTAFYADWEAAPAAANS